MASGTAQTGLSKHTMSLHFLGADPSVLPTSQQRVIILQIPEHGSPFLKGGLRILTPSEEHSLGRSYCVAEKLDKCYLDQVVKVDISRINCVDSMYPSWDMMRRALYLCGLPSKNP